MTWKLWYALHHPSRTPLFQRVYQSGTSQGRLQRILQISAIYMLLCAVFTLLWPTITTNLGVVLFLSLLMSNNVFGLIWTDRVATTLAKENELATFELLCLIPMGRLGAVWSLSTGSLHASQMFRGVDFLMRLASVAIISALSLVVILPALLLLINSNELDMFQLFYPLLYALALALAFYLDYVQAVVTAGVVGMLASAYTSNRVNARILAVGSFLLLQVAVYLITLIIGFVLLDSALPGDLLAAPAISLALPVVRLIIFYLLHEAVILLLWQLLLRQLNGHAYALQQLTTNDLE